MEMTHTDFTKVTRMKFIKVNTVMMLTTGFTATTWMFTMLSDTTVTGGDVTTFLSVLLIAGRLT
jgi:hypothetical protein